MTNRTYTTIPEIERARTLWERSVLLAERTDGYYKLLLYQLPKCYMVVVWHSHFNVVLKVTTFTGTQRLEPYLAGFSIDNLFV